MRRDINRDIERVRGVARGERSRATLHYDLALERRTGALRVLETTLVGGRGERVHAGLGHAQLSRDGASEARVWRNDLGTWRLTTSATASGVRAKLELVAREGLHAPAQDTWRWHKVTSRAKGAAALLAALLGGLWMTGRAAR
jgi:hypothetical protein